MRSPPYRPKGAAQAREAWQQALAIFEDLQHPDAGQVRDKLRQPGRVALRP